MTAGTVVFNVFEVKSVFSLSYFPIRHNFYIEIGKVVEGNIRVLEIIRFEEFFYNFNNIVVIHVRS